MAHKKKHGHPVPPGNRPNAGPPNADVPAPEGPVSGPEVSSAQAQDPKRRIGDFTGAGEQSYKQPGGLNDANH